MGSYHSLRIFVPNKGDAALYYQQCDSCNVNKAYIARLAISMTISVLNYLIVRIGDILTVPNLHLWSLCVGVIRKRGARKYIFLELIHNWWVRYQKDRLT